MTVILGIDPGSRVTGYGLIRQQGQELHYLDSGCIRTDTTTMSTRLMDIFNGVCELMDAYQPAEVVIEQVFVHQNPSSALKLGHARGAALVACASHRVPVFEYTPRAIKQAVVGYGHAEKAQVAHMVQAMLKLNKKPQSDAADALAIAICHSHCRRFPAQARS